MSDDRNPDGTYISSPYSSAEQSTAGVSYSDSYFSAKNKVEAKFRAIYMKKTGQKVCSIVHRILASQNLSVREDLVIGLLYCWRYALPFISCTYLGKV